MEEYQGKLFVCGYIYTIQNTGYVASWDGQNWEVTGGGTDDVVRDLQTHNNLLWATGEFFEAGGVHTNHIATWNGTEWCAVDDTFGKDDGFPTFMTFYHDTLYFGGGFYNIDSVSGNAVHTNLAKWLHNGIFGACGNTLIKENSIKNNIFLSPNPTARIFQLEFQTSNKKTITVFDLKGRKIYQTESRNEKLNIDLSNYYAGIYFIQVVTDEKVFNAKVVKD